jgi:hypothetical protein
MNREESWEKAWKVMEHWKLPNYFWTAMEKGFNGYTMAPNGSAITTPFPSTYNNIRNHLNLEFREQDRIGWDN